MIYNILIYTSKIAEDALKTAKLYANKYDTCVVFSEKRGVYEVFGRLKSNESM